MFDALEGDAKDFGKEIIPSLVGKEILNVMFTTINGMILEQ